MIIEAHAASPVGYTELLDGGRSTAWFARPRLAAPGPCGCSYRRTKTGRASDPASAVTRAAALIPEPDDFLRFAAPPNAEHPRMDGDGVVYEGFKFDVSATIAAKRYADPFGVDVAYADLVHGARRQRPLSFIGIEPPRERSAVQAEDPAPTADR